MPNDTSHTSYRAKRPFAKVFGSFAILFITGLMLVPIMVILASWLGDINSAWTHILEYILPNATKNTLILLALIALGTGVLGTYLAWLTSMYEFWGRKFFVWALMLPMAIPAYVLAFVSVGFIEYTGPLQTTLRALGVQASIGSIRNVWAAALVLSLVFYPYVYLLARQAFVTQGRRAIEAGQMLGLTHRQAFWSIALPQARPWIVGGILIASMETVADFGAVSVFNVETLTTAIYKVWFSLYQLETAAQLASLLIIVVLMCVIAEQYWHSKRYAAPSAGRGKRFVLSKYKRIIASSVCGLVFLFAFLLPVMQLAWWSVSHWQEDFDERYWHYIKNTLIIATASTVALATLSVVMAWLKYQYPTAMNRLLVSLSGLGYAMPGTVLAVGVLIPIAWLDNLLIDSGIASSQVLSGSLVIMIVALLTRFFAVSFLPVDKQLQRLTPSQKHAAMLLTDSPWQRLRYLVLPVLRTGAFTALLIGFVEVMKEMPITLMTRRHDWDTLAVRIFEMTSESMWTRAALPSLIVIAVGLVPVWWLIRQSEKD